MDGGDADNAVVVQFDDPPPKAAMLPPFDEDGGDVLAAFVAGGDGDADAFARYDFDGDPIAGGQVHWLARLPSVGVQVREPLPTA